MIIAYGKPTVRTFLIAREPKFPKKQFESDYFFLKEYS